jgi:succinyl-diaminopimelate desuccinylase
MQDILAWAKRFVATPSVSRDGNEAMAKLAAELLAEVGLAPRLVPHEHEGVQHFSVVAEAGPEPTPDTQGLLLVTHLDTVPPGDRALWTETGGDPFAPTLKGDLLYGLGSADAKVDLVCKASALADLELGSLTRPLRIVGTFAEEIGLVGARWLVGSGLLDGFRYGLIGEPSELAAIRAHKGYAVFEARIPLQKTRARGTAVAETVLGASAHSSTPHLGENAIADALSGLSSAEVAGLLGLEGGGAVNQVPASCHVEVLVSGDGDPREVYDPAPLVRFACAWRARLAELATATDADFDPDHTVGNLGRVTLQEDTAVLHFDVRPIPGTDALCAVAPLQELATLSCIRRNPPLATPVDSPLVRAVERAQQKAGLGARIATKATCTEAGLLAEAGLDCLVLGPGPSVGNVHRPNEHTRVAELHRAREIYRDTIRALCCEAA